MCIRYQKKRFKAYHSDMNVLLSLFLRIDKGSPGGALY